MNNITKKYDLLILGWGAAAFSAAIKASELSSEGMSIALIGHGPIGGTCVNVGCVPSKYLIEAGNSIFKPRRPTIKGIRTTEVGYDFSEVMDGLRSFVNYSRTTKYEQVIKNYKNVDLFNGLGKFIDSKTVRVYGTDGKELGVLSGSKILIATGSSPSIPNITGLKEAGFLTSDNLWEIKYLPETVAIIGGGAIGLEIGQALTHFGSNVIIIEALSNLLPNTEPEIGEILRKKLESEGMKFYLKTRVASIEKTGEVKILNLITPSGTETLKVQEIIVATGRKPNTEFIEPQRAGIEVDSRGYIITNEMMETSVPGIYAAGDCVSKKLYLETLAAREGVIAVSNMFGENLQVDYNSTPWAVFTTPQVAGVGMTENEFSRVNGSCSCRTFKLENLTKASIMGETEGLIKITVDPSKNRIVGIHIIAPNATDIITEGAYAVRYGYTIEDIISTAHIFPSMSEGIKLAAQSFIRDISKMSCCVE